MLSSIANELSKEGGTLVLLHGNADADALASAFAVQQAFPDITIGVSGGLDRVSKQLAKILSIPTAEDVSKVQHVRLLVLDTSGPEQLNQTIDLTKAIVVDHHTRNERWEKAALYHCDDSKSSCSEIIYELLKKEKRKISREMALALLFGMLTDSGYFRFAKKETLLTFSEIMGIHDIQMDEAMNLVDLDTDISERISQLKGAQRLKYWKVGDHIVATSQGSAYEASVCKALLGLGADVVFVGSQRGEQFRVSARATQAMVRKGVHLGKLMGGVGSETSNGGGGHPGAAGLTGTGDVEAILNMAAENAMRLLQKQRSSSN